MALRRRSLGALLLAALLAVGGSFVAEGVRADAAGESEAMLERVNEVRATPTVCGDEGEMPAAPPLALDERLSEAARLHAQDMRDRGLIDHEGSDGASVTDRIERQEYAWSAAGENVALGFESVDAVVEGWLASEGHCVNLMRPVFTDLGVGRADDFWAIVFAAPS
jgi:uncharacterized protein YkwD